MQQTGLRAKEILESFLSKHQSKFYDYAHVPLEETALFDDLKDHPLEFTHFHDPYDSLFYSKLIGRALELNPGIKRVIDFGAGSSIPTILAVHVRTDRPQVSAVDIDPSALNISRANVEALSLKDHYSFHLGSMIDFLRQVEMDGPETLIVSNPPYIASPQGATDYHLLPINGGEDGTSFIREFLEQKYPPQTTLALLWGSLCNPTQVIPLIEQNFETIEASVMRIHFGEYTNQKLIKDHLYRLREEGKVSFENTPKGEVQLVVGTILRALSCTK